MRDVMGSMEYSHNRREIRSYAGDRLNSRFTVSNGHLRRSENGLESDGNSMIRAKETSIDKAGLRL